jgi:hypothetical protein
MVSPSRTETTRPVESAAMPKTGHSRKMYMSQGIAPAKNKVEGLRNLTNILPVTRLGLVNGSYDLSF